jgi:hypothetical protein
MRLRRRGRLVDFLRTYLAERRTCARKRDGKNLGSTSVEIV